MIPGAHFKAFQRIHKSTLPRAGLLNGVVVPTPASFSGSGFQSRRTVTTSLPLRNEEPFRKTLKERKKLEQAAKRTSSADGGQKSSRAGGSHKSSPWRLTVGLEIHAQLNTRAKLFSSAPTSFEAEPNSNVALFDLAYPGTQPQFQKPSLIPALRAAVALRCEIQRESAFDRKHYFYHDQPAGYQITQYYKPYAKNGSLTVGEYDGLKPGEELLVTIKQVQMEQDTAKSIKNEETIALVDFNRVGHPLIEIITEPMIHSAAQAVAVVQKIQSMLKAVNAVTTGMEAGGLRADVNVSVADMRAPILGQRVEIKNLNTLQSIHAAIEAESARQIEILESGGSVIGETRAWSLVEKQSRSLRGKEGEVDYRYMPDPDIPILRIGEDLVQHIAQELPPLPEQSSSQLQNAGLTLKDAKTLIALEDGARLDYYDEVVDMWARLERDTPTSINQAEQPGTVVANWVLHEIGNLLSSTEPPTAFTPSLIPADALARILHAVQQGVVTRMAGKEILRLVFKGDARPIENIIADFKTKDVPDEAYEAFSREVLQEHATIVEDIQKKGKQGKVVFLVGQMLRKGQKGEIQAQKAEATLRAQIGLPPK